MMTEPARRIHVVAASDATTAAACGMVCKLGTKETLPVAKHESKRGDEEWDENGPHSGSRIEAPEDGSECYI